MQEVVTKKTEIVKINGKRFLADGEKVREFTKQDEEALLSKLLDRVYDVDISLGQINNLSSWPSIESDEIGLYFDKIPVGDGSRTAIRFHINYIRPVNDLTKYGLTPEEGIKYFIHFDGSKAYLLAKDGYIKSIKDITDDLIDGKLIK